MTNNMNPNNGFSNGMSKNKTIMILVIVIILLVLGGGYAYFDKVQKQSEDETPAGENTTSTTDGVNDGVSDQNASGNETGETSNENILVISPQPNEIVASPEILITGEASGWYFEGSFGITLESPNATVLAQVPATAQGNWMTTDFVPFEATIDLSSISYTGPATLVLNKANPSGLPQNDASISILIMIQ